MMWYRRHRLLLRPRRWCHRPPLSQGLPGFQEHEPEDEEVAGDEGYLYAEYYDAECCEECIYSEYSADEETDTNDSGADSGVPTQPLLVEPLPTATACGTLTLAATASMGG